jgi:hypothetical protein
MTHAILFPEPIYLRFSAWSGNNIFGWIQFGYVNLHLLRRVPATMTRRKLFGNRHAQCCCCRVLFAFVLLVISLIRFHPQWSIYLLRRGRYNKLEGLYLGQNIYIGLHGSVHDSLEWPHTEVKLEIGYCHNNSASQISAP